MALEPPVEYSPIIQRKPIQWPGGARIAVWIIPNIEYFRYDLHSPAALNPVSAQWLPDTCNYSWRDYGVRVGVWRMMEALDRYGIRATVALNSQVCDFYPLIVREGMKREWEFMGHGETNSIRLYGVEEGEERRIIRSTIDGIRAFTGKPPRGWLGPGLAQSFKTLELLAAAGIEYVGDWVNDDQPYPFRIPGHTLLSMPYPLEINDILIFIYNYRSAEDFVTMVKDQFDTLYAEGVRNGRVLGIALHPYIIGAPFRIKALDRVLEYMAGHQGVWFATGSEIVDWYKEHNL